VNLVVISAQDLHQVAADDPVISSWTVDDGFDV
jgi:hypothetical protein